VHPAAGTLTPVHTMLGVTSVRALPVPDPAAPQASVWADWVDVELGNVLITPFADRPGAAKVTVEPETWHTMAKGAAPAIEGAAAVVTAVAPSGIAIAEAINNSLRVIAISPLFPPQFDGSVFG
jgi:hypothetical protein